MDKCQREVDSWPEWKKISLAKYGENMNSRGVAEKAIRELYKEKEEFVKNLYKGKLLEIEKQEKAVDHAKEKLNNLKNEYVDMSCKSVDELYKEYNKGAGVVINTTNFSILTGSFSVI